MQRYAIVKGSFSLSSEVVWSYLPINYEVIWEGIDDSDIFNDRCVVIQGKDQSGWTLDEYVIPRLGSGNMAAKEIDLSHPIMMKIPA